MKLSKIVLCYVTFLAAFAYACDAFSAERTPTGPLGTSDVVFVYGSQVPGNVGPSVTVGLAVPTMYVFATPLVIKAHAPTHRRATLNHANRIARNVVTHNLHRESASYTGGDLAGAPQDLSAHDTCETVGPRLDGTKVRICGGSVVAVIGPTGIIADRPFTAGIY